MVAHSSSLNLWLILRRWLAASLGAALAAALPQPIALGAGHTLVPRDAFTDTLGQTHIREVHRYQGLRVWGSELVVHGASPARSGLATLAPMASPALPMLDAATPAAEPIDLDLTPSVTLDRAQDAIRPGFGAAASSLAFSEPELVIYPRYLDLPTGLPGHGELNAAQVHRHLAGYALAYLIRAETDTGNPMTAAWDYLVDAHAGTVLERIPVNQGAAPPSLGADPGAALMEAQTTAPRPLADGDTPALGVGRSLFSGTVQLNTTATRSGFTLLDTTRGQGGVFSGNAVTDVNHTAALPFTTGTLYTNLTNDWGNGTAPALLGPTTTTAGQTVAVDAAYGLQSTWDYFSEVHRRNGIDDHGTGTYVRVNFGGNAGETDNAFWSSSTFSMTVQDGLRYWPLTNLTIMAHEFSHGVTGSSAGLIYSGESGGLNEATSDIFGVMADTYTRLGSGGTIPMTGANWIIPKYLAVPAGLLSPMRYMYKPSKDFASKDAWYAGLGGIDVHLSSGPMNRAFYFLSQGASYNAASEFYSSYLPAGMNGIGNDAAARIWYRALTVYLTASSNYLQARTAALRAAVDLFPPDAAGNASRQTIAVRKAFGAINVGNPNATVDDFGTPAIAVSVSPSGTTTPSGSNLTLSSTASNPFGISEVDYFVDQILVAAAFNAPSFTVAQLDTAHLLANGNHSLTASAFAPSGNSGTSLSVPFTVNNPVQQLLKDPGLEGGGLIGWQGDTSLVVQTDYSGTVAHGGYRYVQFDRSAGRQSLTLSQPVAIPAGNIAQLSLWTQTQGNPALTAADTLQIQVQPAGNGAPAVLDTLTSQQARADWLQRSYDLSAYAGQTVTVNLVSNINSGTGTAFLADDFVLACSSAPQVQVQVSLDPANFSAAPLTADRFITSGPVGPLYARVTGSAGSTAVTWRILEGAQGGSLSAGATPTYQRPITPGIYHVVATSVADPNASAQVSIQAVYSVNLVPATATMEAGATLPFTAVAAPGITPVFSVSGGSLAANGPTVVNYTAPAAPGTYTLTVRDAATGIYTATATITVIAPLQVSINPAALTMVTGSSTPLAATVTGSSNTSVVWTIQEGAAGGTITAGADDAPPVYTAPAVPGVYHVIATSVADPVRSAMLTVTVQAGSISINPTSTSTIIGGTIAFQAFTTGNQTVTWSVPAGANAGTIDSSGVYTAPGVPGSYLVTASVAGGGLSASATVRVLTTNFSGDGRPFMNPADLAIMANAWGSSTGAANFSSATDLNQDGTVDDRDVGLFFSQFGGLP